MRIVYREKDISLPNSCSRCTDDLNGVNYVTLNLVEDFEIVVSLCDICLNELDEKIAEEEHVD